MKKLKRKKSQRESNLSTQFQSNIQGNIKYGNMANTIS